MKRLLKGAVGKGKANNRYDIKMLQTLLNRHLNDIKIAKLKIDGKFGDKTSGAIKAFQKQEKLKIDGIMGVSGQTVNSLVSKTASNFTKLPLKGDGFYGKPPASELYGTKKTIESLKSAGRKLKKDHDLEFGVTDISRSYGGYFPPHKTHRLGYQVDIRPLRKDDKKVPVNVNNREYSREKTEKLVNILKKDPNVKSILFNDKMIHGVKEVAGHNDHLHVDFKE